MLDKDLAKSIMREMVDKEMVVEHLENTANALIGFAFCGIVLTALMKLRKEVEE